MSTRVERVFEPGPRFLDPIQEIGPSHTLLAPHLERVAQEPGPFAVRIGVGQRPRALHHRDHLGIGFDHGVGRHERVRIRLLEAPPHVIVGIAASHDVESADLVADPRTLDLFRKEIGRVNPLFEVKHHRVMRAVLANRDPSRGNGELTPAGKLVHKAVVKNFQKKIDSLFAPEPPEDVIQIDGEAAP